MRSKNKVPAIRFKKFDEEWEVRKFSDLYKVCSGYAFKLGDYVKDGVPIINGECIKHGIVDSENYNYLPFSFKDKYPEFLLVEGDIVVGLNRPIINGLLKIARIPHQLDGSLLYQRAGRIKFLAEESRLFSFFFLGNEILKHTLKEAVGSDQPFISTSKLDKWKMWLPFSNDEKNEIGKYLQQLDTLISMHQKKHDKLLNLKKSLLEKIFPKQGRKEPEIRFKGFSGEWEEKVFGDCFANIPNNTLSRSDLNYEAGLAKNIHYGDVLIKFGEVLDVEKESLPFITNNKIANKLKPSALQDGDVVITDAAEDDTVGKCCELFNIGDMTVFSGLHTIAVRPVLIFSSKYLGYYLNSSSYHDQLLSLMQGTKVLSISKTAIKNTCITYPKCLKEQANIGRLFQQLDTLLNQHQAQLKKLNNIKQACLEKMFV